METIEIIKNKYFRKEFSPTRKGFFLAAFSATSIFFLSIVLSVLLKYGIAISIGLCIGLILNLCDIYFADITGRYTVCGLFLILLVNGIALPGIYVFRGEFVTGLCVYFVLGVLYCAVIFEGWLMHVTAFFSFLVLGAAMIYVYQLQPITSELLQKRENMLIIGNIMTVIACGINAGICVKYKIVYYEEEREKAEKARNDAEVINEAKNVFLSNMSHEIRTPMNAILGTSQLLLETDIDDMAKDKVFNILNACGALLSTVGDLLDFSRLESGRIKLEEETYDFHELLEDIINMISVRVMDKAIEFLVDIDEKVPSKLYGDGKRLRQVFINILNNSVKYTKSGNITLKISLENKTENDFTLVVSVKDTGIGIKEQDYSKVFGDYERINTANSGLGEVEGTGLGLSICKEIIELMGGSISFESVFGEGTEFVFKVTQKISQDAKLITVENPEQYNALIFEKDEKCDEMLQRALEHCSVTADSAMGGAMFRSLFLSKHYTHIFIAKKNYSDLEDFLKKHINDTKVVVLADVNQTNLEGYPGTILVRPAHIGNVGAVFNGHTHGSMRKIAIRGDFICPGARVMAVDDNMTNLLVIESILSKYDMTVFTASGGKECLVKLENEQVDLIFLDYMMPEMDGIDTLKNIRKMDKEWVKKVPIIALTANAVSGVREMLLGEGFDEYISKPIEIARLESCLNKFLPEGSIKPVISDNADE